MTLAALRHFVQADSVTLESGTVELVHVTGAENEIFTNAPKIVNAIVSIPEQLTGTIVVTATNISPDPTTVYKRLARCFVGQV